MVFLSLSGWAFAWMPGREKLVRLPEPSNFSANLGSCRPQAVLSNGDVPSQYVMHGAENETAPGVHRRISTDSWQSENVSLLTDTHSAHWLTSQQILRGVTHEQGAEQCVQFWIRHPEKPDTCFLSMGGQDPFLHRAGNNGTFFAGYIVVTV